MDIIKFINEWNRLCKNTDACVNCPLNDYNCTTNFSGHSSEEIVAVVAKWSEEHPIKT